MKYIFFISIILLGCSTRKWSPEKCNRKHIKMDLKGCYSKDSTPRIEIQKEIKIVQDSSAMDSVANALAEYYDELLDNCMNAHNDTIRNIGGNDTILRIIKPKKFTKPSKQEVKDKILGAIGSVPCKLEPYYEKTSQYILKIEYKDGKPIVSVEVLPQSKNCPPQIDKWKWFRYGNYFNILLIIFIGILWRSVKK